MEGNCTQGSKINQRIHQNGYVGFHRTLLYKGRIDVDIYLLNDCDGYGEKVSSLCERLSVYPQATVDMLKTHGFTNYAPAVLYFCKALKQRDNYPISFSISVDKATLKIMEATVLDENFCQPAPCAKQDYEQIQHIIDQFVQDKVFVLSEK